jgi:hypothetical protein
MLKAHEVHDEDEDAHESNGDDGDGTGGYGGGTVVGGGEASLRISERYRRG